MKAGRGAARQGPCCSGDGTEGKINGGEYSSPGSGRSDGAAGARAGCGMMACSALRSEAGTEQRREEGGRERESRERSQRVDLKFSQNFQLKLEKF